MLECKFFVIAKSAFGVPKYFDGRKNLYRLIDADRRHDKSIVSFLRFTRIDADYGKFKEIRVLNPSKFLDFPISWVIAQTAVHVPEIAVCGYTASRVIDGIARNEYDARTVTACAISGDVYDWQGIRVSIKSERGALW